MAIEDVLGARVVIPVWIGFFDFEDTPVYGWTGPGILTPTGTGDADLDSNVFLPTSAPIDITDIEENQGIGNPVTITFGAGEMDDEEPFLELVIQRQAFLGRTARLWRAFMQADESAIHTEIQSKFTGVMVGANTTRQPGAPAVITLTCDQDLSRAAKAPLRWIDHQVFNPTDTASSFITDLARGPLAAANPGQNALIPGRWENWRIPARGLG